MRVECFCCHLEATTFSLYVKDVTTVSIGSVYAYCCKHVKYLNSSYEDEISKEDYLARLAMQRI